MIETILNIHSYHTVIYHLAPYIHNGNAKCYYHTDKENKESNSMIVTTLVRYLKEKYSILPFVYIINIPPKTEYLIPHRDTNSQVKLRTIKKQKDTRVKIMFYYSHQKECDHILLLYQEKNGTRYFTHRLLDVTTSLTVFLERTCNIREIDYYRDVISDILYYYRIEY
jgi:hypothetical protein